MLKVVDLPIPKPDSDLIESLKDCVDQAERGEFKSCVVVKLREDGGFMIHKYGKFPSLMLVGAMNFAISDIIHSNVPEEV